MEGWQPARGWSALGRSGTKIKEGWQSGLTRRTRNAVGEKSPQRFESSTLRSEYKYILMTSQEPTLEEYGLDISVYKNYREKLSALNEKLVELEKNKKLLSVPDFIPYGISYFLSFLLLTFLGGSSFWENAIYSIFIAIYPALFLDIFLDTDFVKNTLSLGKFNEINRLSSEIKTQVEELKDYTQKKLQPFEKAASDYYQSKLNEFFENNLYKKRAGNQQFEEALSEFSSMIQELSTMNSVFITTGVSFWDLQEYKEYLRKRTINHNLQISKKSGGLAPVRNFVRKFSEPQGQKHKEIVAPEKLYRAARKIDNWEEINKKRRITGLKGEEIVVAMEQEYFESIGRKELADKVRHVAIEDGDGLGYDVLSFFADGKEKYIEVKSTTTSLESPYYLSKNELEFLKEHTEDAFIYRVLVSSDTPQIKTYLSSEVLKINEIIPTQYIVLVK